MLFEHRTRGLYLAGDEGGGGAGAAVADPPAEGTGADAVETPPADAQPDGTETGTPESQAGGEEGAEGDEHPQGTGRTYTDSDMARMRRGLEAGFEKKLSAALTELRQSLTGEVSTLRKDVDTLRPPPKDALETLIEGLPDGDESAAEDSKAWQDAEFKKNATALMPLLKYMRPALMGKDVEQLQAVSAGLLQSFDRLRFVSEQLIEFAQQVSEAMANGDPEAMKKIAVPAGIKHLDRIETVRKEGFEKSGRTSVPTYRGSFDTLLKQLKSEEASAVKQEETIRADERTRTQREATQRKTAAGAPGNAAPAPRGPGAGKSGPRTFDQIERDIQAGVDVVLP